MSALDPRRLAEVARELYVDFAATANAATANGARRVGIGFDIGERLSRAVHDALEVEVLQASQDVSSRLALQRHLDEILAAGDDAIVA